MGQKPLRTNLKAGRKSAGQMSFKEGYGRVHLQIHGAVQGVGFRPFVFRLANELSLCGWVINSTAGVIIEVEGRKSLLDEFIFRLQKEKPPPAFIQSLESTFLDPAGYNTFEIKKSDSAGEKSALILPDIATCEACLHEVFDSSDRRYLYPFTNCTFCGPRFSIITALPYDRPHTTMKHFRMCPACRAEYEDPRNRRFHAQPNACPECGPHLELWTSAGEVLASRNEALLKAADSIRKGAVVAIKGLGGFHLAADARNAAAIRELRRRKSREEKPFALMCSSLEQVKSYCEVSPLEERIVTSPPCPIVLLRKKEHPSGGTQPLAEEVAPGNPTLGMMLPYTPLHHILLAELGFPIVATSGNRAEEPICTDENDALKRLGDIADLFLVHNRPIARHADDSIVRAIAGRETLLRRARGFAPLPIHNRYSMPKILAVGAHLKNTVALAVGREIFVSQHIGDLETSQAFDAFSAVIEDFERLYSVEVQSLACDRHPDYLSSRFAGRRREPVVPVQHHLAHVFSCMLDNDLEPPVLGVSWDGTGYGLDGTVWGGEFFHVAEGGAGFRIAHLRRFRLPGGDAAVQEPRRSAVGLLFELFGPEIFNMKGLHPLQAFSAAELRIIIQMVAQKLNAPLTSSAGRLFDAVAGILDVRQFSRFEGQAAMELEYLALDADSDKKYEIKLTRKNADHASSSQARWEIDWEPMVRGILDDLANKLLLTEISTGFHNSMAEAIVMMAKEAGVARVALSGGCFQNKYLTERVVRRLYEEGFSPYRHQRIPPNDGGIAPGQVMAAFHRKE